MRNKLTLYFKGFRDDFSQAECFQQGIHVPKNTNKAWQLYHRAADHNHPTACFRLGQLEEQQQNLLEAFEYYCKAAFNGHMEAKNYLLQLARKFHTPFTTNAIAFSSTEVFEEKPQLHRVEYAPSSFSQKPQNPKHNRALATREYEISGLTSESIDDKKVLWDSTLKKGPVMYRIGQLYQHIEKDNGAAFVWYHRATNEGHTEALNTLVQLSSSDPQAALHLAQLYEEGRCMSKNMVRAFEYYANAASLGASEAHYRLAEWFEIGLLEAGIPKNLSAAFRHYRRAVNSTLGAESIAALNRLWTIQKSAELAYTLAEAYRLTHNLIDTLPWYLTAINLKHEYALADLCRIARNYAELAYQAARAFEIGETIEKNQARAYRFYGMAAYHNHGEAKKQLKSAAQSGDPHAQYALAYEYYHRKGAYKNSALWAIKAVGKNHALAMKYLDTSQLDVTALLEIARHYDEGIDVGQDRERAITFYTKASELGSDEADFRLGELYQLDNSGTETSTLKAMAHYQRASKQGYLPANIPLKRLHNTFHRDSLLVPPVNFVPTLSYSRFNMPPQSFPTLKKLERTRLKPMADREQKQAVTDEPINIDETYRQYVTYLSGRRGYYPAEEQHLRQQLMKALLTRQGWSFSELHQNLAMPSIMVERDIDGWMKPIPPSLKFTHGLMLPDHPAIKTFQSIHGMVLDSYTGEISFSLKVWQAGDPYYERLLTVFDLLELLSLNPRETVFSLDPIDPKMRYHPFNFMRFSPPSLYGTELLHAHC